ncbi:MAG: hypothetical protein ACREV7_06720 [Steroidobacteraceae bacterium]
MKPERRPGRLERLARAADGQHHGRGIDGPTRQAIASLEPAGAGGAQLRQTCGARVGAEAVKVVAECLEHLLRRLVPRLARAAASRDAHRMSQR